MAISYSCIEFKKLATYAHTHAYTCSVILIAIDVLCSDLAKLWYVVDFYM